MTDRSDRRPSIAKAIEERTSTPRLPGYGIEYTRLADRHKPVSELREFVTKGRDMRCAACRTSWPCEVGRALAIVAALARWQPTAMASRPSD